MATYVGVGHSENPNSTEAGVEASTMAMANAGVDSCDLVLQLVPANCGSDLEVITFNEFRWESINPDLRAGAIACSGRCMSYTVVS